MEDKNSDPSPSSSGINKSNDDNNKERQWSANFLTGASPPKFVSLDEIINAANGMTNMALAHEIAVDKNFKLDPALFSNDINGYENEDEGQDDNGTKTKKLQKKVKEIMHNAFWNLLKQQLNDDPPDYTQALVLLREIRETLEDLVLPHHKKIRENLREILDIDLIKQQAEKGVLNFTHYSHYVLNLMSKICAPVRDEKIRELLECTDIVDTFKGIMETLQLMKLDLANFTITMMRPNIVASSIEYEKKKFAQFLEIQADGLQYTRRWLLKHLDDKKIEGANDVNGLKQVTHYLLAEAYLDLLNWDSCPEAETLMLDQGRLLELRDKINRLTIIGSILLICGSTVGGLMQDVDKFKKNVKQHLDVILDTVHSNKELEKIMPNVVIQIKEDINVILKEIHNKELDKETESILERQIMELTNEDHKIRSLVNLRIRQFLEKIILSQNAVPTQVPPGLSSLQEELASIAARFFIIVAHNRSVFGEYYQEIVATEISNRKSTLGSINHDNAIMDA
ncbi:T-complex protein 11-like protein 1 [Microplitis demolitor]|uniref:T-complex protein 11-like protein 1 n=1 Tax=Microplitis demolitor TaxID=69319 RepID=UPI0004400100|nr:T-complex protein 11-like protein 1 [Microplitis demolitor]